MAKPIVSIPVNRGQHNPFSAVQSSTTPVSLDGSVGEYEAIVIDVITNDTHAKYQTDGYNVGAIKFRSIASDQYRLPQYLNWALPADTNMTDYPLLNEMVVVFSALNRWYYHRRLNVTAGVTSHAMPGVAIEMGPINSNDRSQVARNNATNGNPIVKDTSPSKSTALGKYFKEPDKIYRLRHDEGDIMFEGRSGASIRFGHSWLNGTLFKASKADQSPNILIRAGQDPNAKPSVATLYGLITENIDTDASSIYVVSDQQIPLTYSTKNSQVHGASIDSFPHRLEGSQIVMNSDSLTMNTKKGKMMGFALEGIHWTSAKDFSVDAERDYVSNIRRDGKLTVEGNYSITTTGRNSFIAPKNYLGSENDESQPIPAGAVLAKFMMDFIDAHLQHASSYTKDTHGDSGILDPGVVAALTKLKADVAKGAHASFNSTNSYTTT